ncbi:hypothetical protein [Campylobacter troglodytis]|uniref:hypothetical protein n=1 Tax=Campylobacter troglodytis TaxID=654363 RepID=UPI00115C0E0B|nr:hypothetical protein [Campylobacter troglodytis]TQR54621.1 hypothetical protein DMC01_10065 [Campylobacter troglodytis]
MSCVCGYLVYVEYDKFKRELEFVDCYDFVTQNLAMTGKGKNSRKCQNKSKNSHQKHLNSPTPKPPPQVRGLFRAEFLNKSG